MFAIAPLLRALGLEVLNALCRPWTGPEEPKLVLRSSFWRTASKTSIHVIPIASLGGLIWMNYGTLYIGPTITVWAKADSVLLAIIQVLAKILELLCVASLSTNVLDALRRELLSDGVPIGMLGSGTWFASISAFWSPEFLLAAPWSITTFRRCQLYGLVIVSGAIAALVGPSSAVLMLPRYQNMPAGATSFSVGGNTDRLYPANVTSALELDVCTFTNATKYAVCPSGGFTSLRTTLATFNYSDFNQMSGFRYSPQIQATGAWGDWFVFDITVQSPQSLLPPVLSTFTLRSLGGETSASQPHGATANVMQQLVRDWADLAGSLTQQRRAEWKWSYDLAASGSATNPNVRSRCASPQLLSMNETQVNFPYLVEDRQSNVTFWSDSDLTSIAGLSRNHSAYLRTQWLPLRTEEFGGLNVQPTGLLVEFPWVGENRVVFGCSVAAAWHNSTISADRSTNYDAWKVDRIVSNDHGGYIPQNSPDSEVSNKPVVLDDSWLRLLTPKGVKPAINSDTWEPSTLEILLDDAGYNNALQQLWTEPQWLCNSTGHYLTMLYSGDTSINGQLAELCEMVNMGLFVEFILALLVTDGLSRYGSHSVYDVQPLLPDWTVLQPHIFNSSYLLKRLPSVPSAPSELVSRWMAISVVGYGYYASTTTDYLALTVVCAYILLTTFYMAWRLLFNHHITSSSWETITELLVLCQNSPPPADKSGLANTSGGIHRLATYSTLVSIRAAPSGDVLGHPALRLVVADQQLNQTTRKNTVGRSDKVDLTSPKAVSQLGAVSTYVQMVQAAMMPSAVSQSDSRTTGHERVKLDIKYV